MHRAISFKDNYEDEYFIFIKTIQVYNHELELVDEILVEQVSNHLGDVNNESADELENECIHNTSTLKWKNFMYYFKRIFNHENHDHCLKLYRYDLVKYQEEPCDDKYTIEEMADKGEDLKDNQCNIIFGQEMGQEVKYEDGSKVPIYKEFNNEELFLDS